LWNFPWTSAPSFYYLAYVYKLLDLLVKNPVTFQEPHLLWICFIIWYYEPMISFKNHFPLGAYDNCIISLSLSLSLSLCLSLLPSILHSHALPPSSFPLFFLSYVPTLKLLLLLQNSFLLQWHLLALAWLLSCKPTVVIVHLLFQHACLIF
jgi:hypothetical protein